MPRSSLRDARCLVTGASSGIGRALALDLARQGARLVLTGRAAEPLHATAEAARAVDHADVHALAADLTSPTDRDRLVQHTADAFENALDLVVHSAGVGAYGRFESHPPDVLRAIFEINVFALAELCRAALPMLRNGRQPALVVLGSPVARRALPGRAEYSASKHAVAGLMDALRAEWAIDGIHVLLVNPGFTDTPFETNLLIDTAYYKTAHRRTMSPEHVAEATLRALRRGRHEITLSLGPRALLGFNRLSPRFVNWGLARWTRRLYAQHRQPDNDNDNNNDPNPRRRQPS